MAQVNIRLNGKQIQADARQTILDVATAQGISIPTLCHDKRLKPFGSCRVCLVKVEGARNFLPSCSTLVTAGMMIDTEGEDVVTARRLALSLLISDHYGDCVSPCSIACPAHIDIQGYIALISAGQYQGAVKLIKEQNPMPVTIGRVCPHPCEEVCRRSRVDEPIAINNLKRFAADYDIALEHPHIPEKQSPTGKRVAIIGAGPSGLSAAYYLALLGHGVSVFEQKERPGGMLRYGIPEYRLPKEILDREIDLILGLDVEIQYGTSFGRDLSMDSLREDGFDALFLGIGAGQSTDMRIDGEKNSHVLSGIDFLAEVASGEKLDMSGKTVVVVGGGNTAMDASRTSLRLGAHTVVVLYRRTRKEMPAHDFEIEEAEEEGVEFHFLAAPTKISEEEEQLYVQCIRMELGPPDESGRRRPTPIVDSGFTMEAHYLITAIGQRSDISCIEQEELVTARDRIKADPETGTTDIDFVFAGGDCVTGAATAIEAIAAGRRAAIALDQFLKTGRRPSANSDEFNISKGSLEDIPAGIFDLYTKSPRVAMPTVKPQVRIHNFQQIETGIPEQSALHEVKRCLECGCVEGFTCGLRSHSTEYDVAADSFPGEKNQYLEYNNLLSGHPPIVRDENKCVKCGICVRVCDEIWGLSVFGYVKRGFETEIAPSLRTALANTACDLCGQCADACPTGALALNPYVPKPGPFREDKKRGICTKCSLGCEIDFNIYNNIILKCTAQPEIGENRGNLCVRGRFGYRSLLPGKREFEYLAIKREERETLPEDQAVRRASDLLSKSTHTMILTSASLSNEEYELIHGLAGTLKRADTMHIPFDEAERLRDSYRAAAAIPAYSKDLPDLPSPRLDELDGADSIVIFNATPGRSWPILEMKVRHATQKGTTLFIINDRPTRLDDHAAAVFRLKDSLYRDFLFHTGKLRISSGNEAEGEAIEYFQSQSADPEFLSRARLKPARLSLFVTFLQGGKTIFISDGDHTASEALEAFLMHAHIQRDRAKLLIMQRGLNPAGARAWSEKHRGPQELNRQLMVEYDTLLLYRLPRLFPLKKQQVIHFAYAPLTDYGRGGLFFPSSSFLETGGAISLYNGEETSLIPVLKNEANLDNARILRGIIRQLK
jgi:formate dehydrogenase major subunit